VGRMEILVGGRSKGGKGNVEKGGIKGGTRFGKEGEGELSVPPNKNSAYGPASQTSYALKLLYY
jgi:hypothetical protein